MTMRNLVFLAFLPMTAATGGDASTPATVGLRLPKTSVIQYEPIFAEIVDPDRIPGSHGDRSRPAALFESRKIGDDKWTECPTQSSTFGLDKRSVTDAVGGQHEVMGLVIINRSDMLGPQCALGAVGGYEIRWDKGAPQRVFVKPVPEGEREGAGLMRDNPWKHEASFLGPLASSVYAGYIIFRLGPGFSQGPVFSARNRKSQAELFDAKAFEFSLRREETFVLAAKSQLTAHPEFIFADRARLALADALVFLGRCSEARDQLLKVQAGDEDGQRAARYLLELETVLGSQQSVCKS